MKAVPKLEENESGLMVLKKAKLTQKLEKLKRKILNILKMYDLSRVVPWEREHPERKCGSFRDLEVLSH